MLVFLRSCFSAVWRRGWSLVILNWLFFGFIVVGSLLVEAGFVKAYAWPLGDVFPKGLLNNALFLFGFIFVFNLALSSFVLVTLTGLVFFGLSPFFLCYRALLWGILLADSSPPMFLTALPVLALEGEGYVLAALAGVNLGLSWLEPRLAYRGEDLSRSVAFKRALKDCGRIYVLIVIFMFVASVVETTTLIFF